MNNGYEKFFRDVKNKKRPLPTKDPTAGGRRTSMRDDRESVARTPEEQLRMELRRRLREQRMKQVRAGRSFPTVTIMFVGFILTFGLAVYFWLDEVEFLLSQVQVTVFGTASAAGASSENSQANPSSGKKPSPSTVEKEANSSQTRSKDEVTEVTPLSSWTAEELKVFYKLNDRKRDLDQREAELVKMEEELQKQKVELEERIRQLESMREQISSTLKERVEVDQEKVDKLVEFYSNMKPQKAAKIIESLNESLAVEVVSKMKKKNAAEVLNLMEAKKAKRLSELLTGYQRGPAASTSSSEMDASDKSGEN